MIRWFRTAFWLLCATIALLSLVPVQYLPEQAFNWSDKAQHALAFAALGGMGLLAYPLARGKLIGNLLIFGGGIELAQAATGWRYGEWGDWLADALGLAVVWMIVWMPVLATRVRSIYNVDTSDKD